MSGHSKWANIKRRKGAQDAVKSKIFTKLIRELTVAARHGGGDVSSNSRLRLAMDRALSQNMSRDTIDRAVKRGVGGEDGSSMEEVRYEGYGPSGVAMVVDCMTDNRNRTVSEVRQAFTKHGGNLGMDGSVAYLFKRTGLFCFAPKSDENKIMQVALDSGAEDVVTNDDGSIEVLTAVEDFAKVKAALDAAKLVPEMSELTMIAAMQVVLNKENAEKIMRLVDALDELDDVQHVYSNADMSADTV